jgi:hypothetical protein
VGAGALFALASAKARKKKEREKSESAEQERKKRKFALFPPGSRAQRCSAGEKAMVLSKMYSTVC